MCLPLQQQTAPLLLSRAAAAARPLITTTKEEATTPTSSRSRSNPILHDLPAAPGPDPAYDTHVATSPFQKAFIAGFAAVTAVRDPERGDMVAALGETTGGWAGG